MKTKFNVLYEKYLKEFNEDEELNLLDEKYFEAINAKDMETVQRMVDEKANTSGTRSFNDEYPTYSSLVDGVKQGNLLVHARKILEDEVEDLKHGLEPTIGETLGNTEAIRTSEEFGLDNVKLVFASDGYEWVGNGRNGIVFVIKDGFQKSLGDGKVQLANGKIVPYEKSPIADFENDALKSEPAGVEKGDWYSIKIADVVGVSTFNKKLSDPITYDDNGKIIPLSKRFNPKNSDPRY